MTRFHSLQHALLLVLFVFITPARAAETAAPLVIGETFTIPSKILNETRRINVYLPPGYAEARDARFPVLYMPDGGLAEDFLHVAGLVQVSVGNGTMRPFVLVGIENTERRRDMTGPTDNAEDKKIAPRVGGSAAFRKFLREELMPEVKRRYRTAPETAIVGESLAGLFVVETFLLEPDLFDTYMAFDPSLWWNDEKLIKDAAGRLRSRPDLKKTLYFAGSADMGPVALRFAEVLGNNAPRGVDWHYEQMPEEKHSTIYHPAALRAFRAVLKPAAPAAAEEPKHLLFLQDVAWSPDGRRIAFSRYSADGPFDNKNWKIWIADRDGAHPRPVLDGAVYTSFSPDGQRLAAGRLFDGDWELVTVRTDGSDLRRLTRRAGEDEVPSWSPDGKSLAYSAMVDGNLDLYQIPAEGGAPRRLTTDPAKDYNPVFSPDGRRLVFYRETGDRHDQIWTLDLATGRESRLTDGTGHNFFPFFLPDGRIAFSGQRDGGERRLFIASADGRSVEPVGPPSIFFARPSPDGKEILFLIQGQKIIQRMGADGQGAAKLLDAATIQDSP